MPSKKKVTPTVVTPAPIIFSGSVTSPMLIANITLTLFYFLWWFNFQQAGNPILYILLFFGETYHVLMVLMFWFTVRKLHGDETPVLPKAKDRPRFIDIFVTVAGEPLEIVEKTVRAIQKTKYKYKHIYILNDSYVAKKSNWQEYELLAKKLKVSCLTRRVAGGAKAGNINSGLRNTSSELIAIFDADMCPEPSFFDKTVPYFVDAKIGFVQTPQYYRNFAENVVTSAAWEQQEFFFGPIMRGKQASNAAFICGTNVVIRRTAIEQVGGMNEESIAEDFLTSLYIHQRGWKSIYVPEVLAQGLAPSDLLSYYKQQSRWSRGSVEVLFRHNPLLMKNLTWAQKIEYLSSALYYCNGLIVAIDIMVPVFFLLFATSPIQTTTTVFAIYFLPFITSIIYSLHKISNKNLTFRAISFTQASWFLQIQSIFASLTGHKTIFSVTPKKAQTGNFLFLAYPHLAYAALALFSVAIAFNRDGFTPALLANISWVTFNLLLFFPYIGAAFNWKELLIKAKLINPEYPDKVLSNV